MCFLIFLKIKMKRNSKQYFSFDQVKNKFAHFGGLKNINKNWKYNCNCCNIYQYAKLLNQQHTFVSRAYRDICQLSQEKIKSRSPVCNQESNGADIQTQRM